MLTWAIIFFIISILAGLFGFKRVQSASTTMAKVLFFIFLVLFIISLVFGLVSMESH